MLVVSRRLGESVWIGRICFTLLGKAGGKIRVGIQAPKRLRILRDELRQKAQGKDGPSQNGERLVID